MTHLGTATGELSLNQLRYHGLDKPERKPRCLRLVVGKRGKNQCESEQAPGYELCPHHLAAAARDYNEIVAEAAREYGEEATA